MLIQFNTSNQVEGRDEFITPLHDMVEHALKRFSDRLSSVQVHLDDENSHKGGGNDKRCMMEARVDNLKPVSVTVHADTYQQAVKAASDKLKAALTSTFDKMRSY